MDGIAPPQLVQTGPEWYEAGLAFRYETPVGPGPYPTAVLIHGRLGDENVMWIFRKAVPQPWLVVAPRAPLADKDLFSWLIQPRGEWLDLDSFRPAADVLARFLRALPRLYNADPDRLYLMGFSQGAATALATALHYPGLIRGIASLVGFAPATTEEAVAGRLAGLPVFMAVGKEDQTVPLAQAQQAAALVRAAGAELEYHEYEIGHKLSAAGLADLRAWFHSRV